MFIRFRQSANRLNVSLVEAHQSNGTVKQRHLASLGTVGPSDKWPWVPVRERAAIWQLLHDAIGRLSIGTDVAQKLMAALQERVPYPTQEEHGAADLAEAEHDAAFWERFHGGTTKLIDSHKTLIRTAEVKISELEIEAKREAEAAEDAKAKAARLGNYRGA
jgi:hypothetical protein